MQLRRLSCQQPHLKQRGLNGQLGRGLMKTMLMTSHGMPNVKPQIPAGAHKSFKRRSGRRFKSLINENQ
ncbi:MAG: hypothetical protein EBW74_13055 [Betaproteobacteria bacterium]|nr:hypothetical protein [Betaproteobacteria bacterium]